MPLKVEDLKTTETYKKAMKVDVSKITPSGNIKFWFYRDVELPTASGGKEKLKAFLVLVDNRIVLPALKGKMMICRGIARLHEGKIDFEAQQGDVPYDLIKLTLPRLLEKPLYIPVASKADAGRDAGEKTAAAKPEVPPPPPPPPANRPNYAQLNTSWNELLQRARQAVAADSSRKGELTQAAEGIPALLSSGNFQEAQARMERLAKLLQAPSRGFLQYRTSLLQFAQAKSVVGGQIATLKGKILADYPDQAELADQLAGELEDLNQELAGVVDEAMKVAGNQGSPVTDAVRLKIRRYLTEIGTNPLVKQADTNPLGVPVTIAKTLGGALARIQQTMPA